MAPDHHQYRAAASKKMPIDEGFTIADAAHLKLQLQALDGKIKLDADIETLKEACQSRPFHDSIRADGSEFLYLAIRSITSPDRIPAVYIEAFATLQKGRFPMNERTSSDSRKGVDPDFSQVRALLPRIDELCGTGLAASLHALEDRAKRLPFLNLPAELRLQIYSYLIPREAHLAIIHRPPGHKSPRIRLDIMRTNKQIYEEVVKYFYEDRTLFMISTRDRYDLERSAEYHVRYYEAVHSMNPRIRELFTRIEVHISFLPDQIFPERKHFRVPPVANPVREIFRLLLNIRTVLISLRIMPNTGEHHCWDRERCVCWLLKSIPAHIEVQWAPDGLVLLVEAGAEEVMRIEGQLRVHRGPIKIGESCIDLPKTSMMGNGKLYQYKAYVPRSE